MTQLTRIVSIVIAVVSIVWIVRSLRSEKLTFPFAMSWLAIVVAVVAFAVGGNYVLHPLARLAGIHYPPNLLFLASSVVLLMLCAHLSRQVAGLDRKLRDFTQRYAEDHADESDRSEPAHAVPPHSPDDRSP